MCCSLEMLMHSPVPVSPPPFVLLLGTGQRPSACCPWDTCLERSPRATPKALQTQFKYSAFLPPADCTTTSP